MSEKTAARPLPVLAVFGASDASAEEARVAERVGGIAARAGWVVLTGGGAGVMEAASRGAVEAGGLTVGILPTARADGRYPNPWVRIPIFTDAGSARNAFNVLSADLCIAIGGGPGTLSEIALAVKQGVEVWCFKSWAIAPPGGRSRLRSRIFDDEGALITALEEAVGS